MLHNSILYSNPNRTIYLVQVSVEASAWIRGDYFAHQVAYLVGAAADTEPVAVAHYLPAGGIHSDQHDRVQERHDECHETHGA